MNRTRLVRQSLSSQSNKDPAGLEGTKGLRWEPVLPQHVIFFSFLVVVAVVYWFCCVCFIIASLLHLPAHAGYTLREALRIF